MTEKYYLVLEVSGGLAKIYDNISEENIIDVNEAVDKLNDLSEKFSNLEVDYGELNDENKQLKQKIKFITEILNEDIGYIESFRKIEEVINDD